MTSLKPSESQVATGEYRLDSFSYHIQTILRATESFSIQPLPELFLEFEIQRSSEPLFQDQVKINGKVVGNRAGAVTVFVQMLVREDPLLGFFTTKYIPMPRRDADLPPRQPAGRGHLGDKEADDQPADSAAITAQRDAAEAQLDSLLDSLTDHFDMTPGVNTRLLWEEHTKLLCERRKAQLT